MSEVFVVFIHCFYLLNFQVYAEDLKYLHVKQTYHANNNTHTNKNKRMFTSVKFMVHYPKYFQNEKLLLLKKVYFCHYIPSKVILIDISFCTI